ncbi:hypothetical protein [Pseudonocardia sp. WMMC193]|uniref:hypothetical protein n=1 Tax=Pseudonocardia sp. WMMC193 TaxID=2911965 RepID=UPI001F343D67|nr:hypothetical protein [Pseudonocardia sp. WMMC193]MCF7552604.1 hypothetical protein [Pseudonocardia sp. WMMC193]
MAAHPDTTSIFHGSTQVSDEQWVANQYRLEPFAGVFVDGAELDLEPEPPF